MTAPTPPVVVIKVGGSFLDWPPLPDRLGAYLASRPDIRPVLVVGGGRLADHLRDLDRLHSLGEPRSHALALRVVEVQEHLVGRERQAVRRLELGVERLRERRVDPQHPAPGAQLAVVEGLGAGGLAGA